MEPEDADRLNVTGWIARLGYEPEEYALAIDEALETAIRKGRSSNSVDEPIS